MSADLAAQLFDPSDAALSAASNASVWWRCDKNSLHVWQASPNTRRRSGCPVCINKVVIAGVNDLATTDPDLAAQLADPTVGRTVHHGSHAKVQWVCQHDQKHPLWEASVVARTRLGSGCPYCSGRVPVPGVSDLATTHPDIAAQLVDPCQAETVGAGSSKKLDWRCPKNPEHRSWTGGVPRTRSTCGRLPFATGPE